MNAREETRFGAIFFSLLFLLTPVTGCFTFYPGESRQEVVTRPTVPTVYGFVLSPANLPSPTDPTIVLSFERRALATRTAARITTEIVRSSNSAVSWSFIGVGAVGLGVGLALLPNHSGAGGGIAFLGGLSLYIGIYNLVDKGKTSDTHPTGKEDTLYVGIPDTIATGSIEKISGAQLEVTISGVTHSFATDNMGQISFKPRNDFGLKELPWCSSVPMDVESKPNAFKGRLSLDPRKWMKQVARITNPTVTVRRLDQSKKAAAKRILKSEEYEVVNFDANDVTIRVGATVGKISRDECTLVLMD